MTDTMTVADETELKPCPFCGFRLVIRSGVNAYGRCNTTECWTNRRAVIIPLDDPRQVDEWNTRSDMAQLIAEPTDEMLDAACDVGPDTNGGEFSYDDARRVWAAMFSAAIAVSHPNQKAA